MTDKQKTDPRDKKEKNSSAFSPDPETLNKTDPQDNMKGPLSSLANEVREEMEDAGKKDEDSKEKE